jgi:hypothetical protein
VEEIPDKEPSAPDVQPQNDFLGDDFEEPEPEGRPKRVRKESAYIRRLRDGDASNRRADPAIPTGVQEVQEDAATSDDWEMVAIEDFAMAAVTAGAKGLEPTFEEAKKRPDWPKWEEAIKIGRFRT